MPLLDHFHPPVSERRSWEGFHGLWAAALSKSSTVTSSPRSISPTCKSTSAARSRSTLPPWRSRGTRRANGGAATALARGVGAAGDGPGRAGRVPRRHRSAGLRHGHRGHPGRGHRTGQPRQQGPAGNPPGVRREVRQLPDARHRPDRGGHRDQPAGQPAQRGDGPPRSRRAVLAAAGRDDVCRGVSAIAPAVRRSDRVVAPPAVRWASRCRCCPWPCATPASCRSISKRPMARPGAEPVG